MCMNSAHRRLIVISGPTATGKSDFAVELAQKINGEVVSIDSRQMYIGGDLCSGKITPLEMKGVPHHLLSIFPMRDRFSITEVRERAEKCIQEIYDRGHVPILCGGTGMYIDAIVSGSVLPSVVPNEELRKKLQELPLTDLQEKLFRLDPHRYGTIDINNPRRLIRAIEVAEELGSVPPISYEKKYDALYIYFDMPDDILRERIKRRTEARIRGGMIEEVENLLTQGVSYETLQSLGLEYAHISKMLHEKTEVDTMKKELFFSIWHYAKRQRVWWKKKHVDIVCNPLIDQQHTQTIRAAELWILK
jgi:tRNA dimethylallyltransferase